MPELPEVETTRRGLEPVLIGARQAGGGPIRFTAVTVRNRNLRQRVPGQLAERLTGATVTKLERRAKYILARLSPGADGTAYTLVLHLGMSGSLTVTPAANGKSAQPGTRRPNTPSANRTAALGSNGRPVKTPKPRGGAPAQAGALSGQGTNLASLYHPQQNFTKHDHVVFQTAHATITFNDPRRFGLVLLIPTHEVEEHDLFKHLGPEPLSGDFTAATLRQKLHGKKTALKVAIMDQRVVVGVGNIYASEALFRAKLNPKLQAGKLTIKQANALVTAIKQVLNEAIEAGGSSLRDFKHSAGQLGYFQHNFRVYDRKGEPCPTCQTPIKHAVLGQRSTYWCPICQSSR